MLQNLVTLLCKKRNEHSKFPYLDANTLEVRNINYLKKALGWSNTPLLRGRHLHAFQHLEDLNDRPLRDAEVIGSACCNGDPQILLEIGTSHGKTTALMASNAPGGIVHTINIPPEEINEGGKNVTFAPSIEEIGKYYRNKGCENVKQILANTANWEPNFGPFDVVFIDGCHDADFVYNDTRKVLKQCRHGSIIMWHDFNPSQTNVYHWINDVCTGVERLYADNLLKGRIFHLQDSWVGLYQVLHG